MRFCRNSAALSAILIWLIVQSNHLLIDAEFTVDLLLKSIKVTHQHCVSKDCVLIGELEIPNLSNHSYSINESLPADRSDPFWINRRDVWSITKPYYTFTDSLDQQAKNTLENLSLHTSFRLASGDVRYSLSSEKIALSKLLNPAPISNQAAFHELLIKGNGFELMVLLRMYCSEGFYGPDCDKRCHIPPEFDPPHVMCDGSRFYCRPGWTGLSCELKDPCTSDGLRLCQNDAVCIPTYTVGLGPGDTSTFRCVCPAGWKGPLCSIPDLKVCRYDNNTVGTYSPWKYRWANDNRDVVISYATDGRQFEEMRIVWHRLTPGGPQQPLQRQSQPYMKWDPDQVQPNNARGMWRIALPFSDEIKDEEDEESRIDARGMWRHRSASTFAAEGTPEENARITWKFVTKMEPMEPVQPTSDGIIRCPDRISFNIVPAETDDLNTREDLTEIFRPNWMEHCYQMPCILLRDHVKRLKLAEVHVAWRNAITAAFPMLTNIKPRVTTTWVVLRDRTPVTSVNLHCRVGALEMGRKGLLRAMQYMKVDLKSLRPSPDPVKPMLRTGKTGEPRSQPSKTP